MEIFASMLAIQGTGMYLPFNEEKTSDINVKDIDVTPKVKPIPKGCKRYYFDQFGSCNKLHSTMHFDALTESKANIKYNNHIKSY